MPRQAGSTVTPNENVNVAQENKDIFSLKSAITDNVKMITKGLIPGVPKEVIIKPIQRKDKKKVLMNSKGEGIIMGLLQSSIVSPTDFDVYNLLPFETQYLLYRLRVLTYGDEYKYIENCPHCGHGNELELPLNEMPIKEVPDDFKIQFDIKLPRIGHVLTCRLLNEREYLNASKTADEIRENFNSENDAADVIWQARIVAINGDNSLTPIQKSQYLDELIDLDFEYLTHEYFKAEGNYGLQSEFTYTCENCNKLVESNMPSVYTFFRPQFK